MSEITLNSLPKTLDELKAMPQAALTVPEEVAALTVAALALYPENPAETEKMLDFLRGPRPLNGIDKQFIWRILAPSSARLAQSGAAIRPCVSGGMFSSRLAFAPTASR